MLNKNEQENVMLEDNLLEGVSGGAAGAGDGRFSGQVAPEACRVGQSYYVVQGRSWYYGELTEIAFKNALSGGMDRILKFHTSTHNGCPASMNLSLNASQITLYKSMMVNC